MSFSDEFWKIGKELTDIIETAPSHIMSLEKYLSFPALGNMHAAISQTLDDFNQALSTVKIFRQNYEDMKEANTIGADKYFHAKANAHSSQLGGAGQNMASFISNAREFTDIYKNLLVKRMSISDTIQDMIFDSAANVYGQVRGSANKNKDARSLVNYYRPRGLPEKY